MTEQLSALAVQNVALLRAIGSGPFDSLSALADAAEVAVNNLNRKLASLEDEGLIERTGSASHQVTITELAHRALNAIDVFEGGALDASRADLSMTGVHPDLIDANPYDPRGVVDTLADLELARSVADIGILQRVIVRIHPDDPGRYQQALGHRRVRAARAAGVDVPIEVRDLSDDDMAEIAVVENVQRADLHWMDEAEAYLMLASRGRSASQIQQLCGAGGRKKRSIQELIQFARELDDDAKARCRLPEGDPRRISVDQARAMVGNKRPRPTLALTPKLAVTFLELIFAGMDADMVPEAGDALKITLHARPTGGALTTLSDRGLVKFIVARGAPEARIDVTVDIETYLREIGYFTDPEATLHKARAAVVGELDAVALGANRYLTPELNAPERPEPEPQSAHPREGGDPVSRPADGAHHADDDDADDDAWLDDDEAYDRQMATFRENLDAAQSDPAAHAAGVKPPPTLTPEAALVILEIAHAQQFVPAPPGPIPVPVDASYRLDPLSNQLVFDRMIMFRIIGATTAACLTPTAEAWLDARGIERGSGGGHIIDDVALDYIQVADGREAKGRYVTPWLIDPRAQEAQSAVSKDAPAHAVRDPFADQVAEAVAPPAKVPRALLIRAVNVAESAGRLIEQAESRRLKAQEVANMRALIAALAGDAEAALKP